MSASGDNNPTIGSAKGVSPGDVDSKRRPRLAGNVLDTAWLESSFKLHVPLLMPGVASQEADRDCGKLPKRCDKRQPAASRGGHDVHK